MNQQRPFWMPDMQGFIAGVVMMMAAGALAFRMTHPSPVEDKVLDMMLTIVFSTAFVAIINYLFGSSRGSERKDDAILGKRDEHPPVPPSVTVTQAPQAPQAPVAPPPIANP